MQDFVKELILWAHILHPNAPPFYGVFIDKSKQICLVSPFMNKGSLHDFALRLPQKSGSP
jgi:serine/threonine protein kinase